MQGNSFDFVMPLPVSVAARDRAGDRVRVVVGDAQKPLVDPLNPGDPGGLGVKCDGGATRWLPHDFDIEPCDT